MDDQRSIARGDRAYVMPGPPRTGDKRGKERKYVHQPATVRKLNGSRLLIEFGDGSVAWVNRKFLERLDG